MQEKKQMHKNKAGARRFFLQTPAFYGPLETGLWGFVDSLNDSYGLVHAKLADVKQHLVGLNAAPICVWCSFRNSFCGGDPWT